jgi:hypothetical protein
MRTNLNNTLNSKSILATACIFIAAPLAAQTPAVSQAEPVLMAAAFVPSRTSTAAAKPIADRPLSQETLKPEPAAAPLPKFTFPTAVSPNRASNTASPAVPVTPIPTWTAAVPEKEAPTSRRFGPVTVEPGAMAYATTMGTNITALDRFGAAPGVTRLTFGK